MCCSADYPDKRQLWHYVISTTTFKYEPYNLWAFKAAEPRRALSLNHFKTRKVRFACKSLDHTQNVIDYTLTPHSHNKRNFTLTCNNSNRHSPYMYASSFKYRTAYHFAIIFFSETSTAIPPALKMATFTFSECIHDVICGHELSMSSCRESVSYSDRFRPKDDSQIGALHYICHASN